MAWKSVASGSICIAIGVLVSCVGLECFLLPNHFIDGGVTGVSMLASKSAGVPLPALLLLFNLPFIVLAIGTSGTASRSKVSRRSSCRRSASPRFPGPCDAR